MMIWASRRAPRAVRLFGVRNRVYTPPTPSAGILLTIKCRIYALANFARFFHPIKTIAIRFRRIAQRRYLPPKRIIQLRRINYTIIMVGIKYSFVRNSRQNITQMIRQLIVFCPHEVLKNTESIRQFELLRVDLCQNSQIFHAQNIKSPPNIYKDVGRAAALPALPRRAFGTCGLGRAPSGCSGFAERSYLRRFAAWYGAQARRPYHPSRCVMYKHLIYRYLCATKREG
jgi:hypothetical protein